MSDQVLHISVGQCLDAAGTRDNQPYLITIAGCSFAKIIYYYLLLRPQEQLRSIVMSTSVCVCLSVREDISGTTRCFPNFLCMSYRQHAQKFGENRGWELNRDHLVASPILDLTTRPLYKHIMGPKNLQVSVATDRPAWRRGSAHGKFSVSHHMVIEPFLLRGLAAEYRSRRWMWSTAVRRPSEVYDTHWRTKLTTTETISRSRDMVGAQCPPKFKWFMWPNHALFEGGLPLPSVAWLALATVNLPTKFEVSNSTHYVDMKGDTKCRECSGLG